MADVMIPVQYDIFFHFNGVEFMKVLQRLWAGAWSCTTFPTKFYLQKAIFHFLFGYFFTACIPPAAWAPCSAYPMSLWKASGSC